MILRQVLEKTKKKGEKGDHQHATARDGRKVLASLELGWKGARRVEQRRKKEKASRDCDVVFGI